MDRKAADKEAKAAKKAFAEQQKRMRPGECLKYISPHIDPAIVSQPLGAELISHLRHHGITCHLPTTPIAPFSITWLRANLDQSRTTEDYALLVWPASDLLTSIDSQQFCATLSRQQQQQLGGRPICLIVTGLTGYLELQGAKRQQMAAQIDRQLTRLQILHQIGHRRVESAADLASTVMQFTRAVAEAPFKRQLAGGGGGGGDQPDLGFYAANDNRDCVAVRGTAGLASLWQHQLCKMPMASLETAEAIIGEYAMPRLLMDAYENGDGGADLLTNIPVRRAGGPLTSVRKIGPELSQKMHRLLTSDDPDEIL